MKQPRTIGLWMGLLLALVVAGIVAFGAGPKPSAALSLAAGASAGATPTSDTLGGDTASATVAASAMATTEATANPLPQTAEVSREPTATPTTETVTALATAEPVGAPPEGSTPPAASTSSPTVAPQHTPATTPSTKLELTPDVQPTLVSTSGDSQVIGYSVQGRAIDAHRIGKGPIKVVLVGDIHGEFEENTYLLAEQLLAHFVAHPEDVPAHASLWIIPTMNPDGLATGHRWNANDVDLNRNADTDLDGCAGNDWSSDTTGLEGSHPGAGGEYPFSEPEARAVRDFLDDAQIAVFYHSAAEAIFVDTCGRHAPTARLAEALAAGSGYPVPEEGWPGYPITGDFADYLAGEGVAAVTVELTDKQDPEFERNLAGVQSVLASVNEIVGADAAVAGAGLTWLDEANAGFWQFPEGSFTHPLAVQVVDGTVYLLDTGRVLALAFEQPAAPRVLLSPGNDVEGVRVLEPLDLAAEDGFLLVLDRAGDVYRLDTRTETWTLERYGRPARETSDHYFVALSVSEGFGYLLETSHEQVWRFRSASPASASSAWGAWFGVPRSRDVDLSAAGENVYVLTRDLNRPTASLHRFRDADRITAFEPNIDIMNPRQVVASDAAVYVLDRSGRRILALEPSNGDLLDIIRFPDRRMVSAIWAGKPGRGDGPDGGETLDATALVMAGRDSLYFYGRPEHQGIVEAGSVSYSPGPHDLDYLEALRGLLMPIEGASVTRRDFQMPGAPRHYRLGVHEGMDFYSGTVGVPVNRQTPVRAVDDGVVVRALVDYEPLTAALASAWSAQCRAEGYTPPDVLDGYRGRQVWIDHGNGLVSRYAHLGSIAPDVAEGTAVSRGQVIGTVGNSGTPSSVSSNTVEVHLHLELWVGENYVGQFLRPIEAREWLERIIR